MRLKLAKDLTAAARARIATKNFGIPSKADSKREKKQTGNYPIHDREHARAALAYGKRYLSSAQYAKLKARIKKKYPTMIKDGAAPESYRRLSRSVAALSVVADMLR